MIDEIKDLEDRGMLNGEQVSLLIQAMNKRNLALIGEVPQLSRDRKDRRRRIFEQVAIAYTTKHWPDYQEQPSDQTLMGWAEHTSEIILSSANKFAEKEIKE